MFNDRTELELAVMLAGLLITCIVISFFVVNSNPAPPPKSLLIEQGIVPDPEMTPGATNIRITDGNIYSYVCSKGKWKTSMIRPPVKYTQKLKRKQIDDYGYEDKDLRHYEEDHLISLQLGGHPSSPKNLWPESYLTKPLNARDKDKVENYLKKEVCDRKILLHEAQKRIATDWVSVYHEMESSGYVDPYQY